MLKRNRFSVGTPAYERRSRKILRRKAIRHMHKTTARSCWSLFWTITRDGDEPSEIIKYLTKK